MDGLMLAVLADEWNARYGKARIDKIHQPSERDLVLTVRSREGTDRLLLSAHRAHARAYTLRRQKPSNPEEPPMFCMLLRKWLEGGRIREVRQQALDRVLEIWIENRDELGDVKVYALVLEMMGKHSNLMLCSTRDDGLDRVMDSIVRVTPDMSRVRPVLPGTPYRTAPPQARIPVESLTPADVATLGLAVLSEKDQARRLSSLVAGVGPVTAREALYRAARLRLETAEQSTDQGSSSLEASIVVALRDVFSSAVTHAESPSVGLDGLGRPVVAAPFLLSHVPSRTVVSVDDALEELHVETFQRTIESALLRETRRAVGDILDKLQGKEASLQSELTHSANHEEYRLKGDLLTTYGHGIPKGTPNIDLPNYYDEDTLIRIDLDPSLSAIENAQRYYRLGSKKKRALTLLGSELEQVNADIRYMEQVSVDLENPSSDNLLAIRADLEQQGFFKGKHRRKPGKHGHSKAVSPGQPDTYVSSDGLSIRVGRNNLQNDQLTLRSSKPYDIWLHTKDLAGSHVVISTGNHPVPEATLESAALLAAYFSKGRDSANVPVDYTLIKHVWKPNGARPGFVLYDNQKTLYATPDRALLEPLLNQRAR